MSQTQQSKQRTFVQYLNGVNEIWLSKQRTSVQYLYGMNGIKQANKTKNSVEYLWCVNETKLAIKTKNSVEYLCGVKETELAKKNKERLTVPVRCQELVLVGHDALEGHFLHVGIGMLQELTEKTDTNDMGEYIYI